MNELILINMDITEYDEFYKWYKANERRFHCSQMTEVQIAYSAYLHGIEQSHKHGVSGKYQKTLLRDFFLWICRDAKVEVIDAETSIEIRGDWSDETPLVPVLTVDELVQRFFDTCATAKGGPAGD